MDDSNQSRNIWTLLAFVFAIAFTLHIMLIPVLYGFYAMDLFETDSSVTAAIPAGFVVSAASTLLICATCLVVSKFVERRKVNSK